MSEVLKTEIQEREGEIDSLNMKLEEIQTNHAAAYVFTSTSFRQ